VYPFESLGRSFDGAFSFLWVPCESSTGVRAHNVWDVLAALPESFGRILFFWSPLEDLISYFFFNRWSELAMSTVMLVHHGWLRGGSLLDDKTLVFGLFVSMWS
jgi:hypothetical protein